MAIFGNQLSPAYNANPAANIALVRAAWRHTAGAGETITQISIYAVASAGTPTVDVGIYTFAGGVPVTKIGNATITTSTSEGWFNSSTLSIALTNGVEYVVALGNLPTTIDIGMADGAAGDVSLHDPLGNLVALPATWTDFVTTDGQYGLYATYGVGGGPTPTIASMLIL